MVSTDRKKLGHRRGAKMTEKEKRRIGRPMKKSARGEKRASLGLKVRVAVKKQIDEAAKDSGRTQSQEAEALIERCLTYDVMLKAMNQTIADIAKGNVEAAFRSAGYT